MSASKKEGGSTKDSLIGKKLGDYTLIRVLATGGMANIYEAEDQRLGRQAAVKVLEQERLDSDDTLTRRFQREARAIAALEHDNIITVYQYGEQDGLYFLAMKLVRGNDLSRELSRLRRNGEKMEPERALRILAQVASALDYAHQNSVIHRDVKPSNILLDKNDRAILTDFGLVLHQSIEATLGTAFGTPRYIAPEQATASSKAVPQSDIYSLAVILYEILTGDNLFTGETPMEIALSHISEKPRPPRTLNPDIPIGAEREILKALEKDPTRRHNNALEFITAVGESYGLLIDPNSITSPSSPSASERPKAVEHIDSMATDWGSWDSPGSSAPEAPPAPKIPDAKTEKQRKPPIALMVVAMLIVAAVVIGALLALNNNTQNTGDGGEVNVTPEGSATALNVNTGITTTDEASATESADGTEIAAEATETAVPVFANVRLMYDENGFAMLNEGTYTLEVLPLQFIRGTDGGGDDYTGDRVTRDIVPAGDCIRIQRQNRQITDAPGCPELVHSQEFLFDANMFFWRTEPNGDATFEVRYQSQVIATCETVARGQDAKECTFAWPVAG